MKAYQHNQQSESEWKIVEYLKKKNNGISIWSNITKKSEIKCKIEGYLFWNWEIEIEPINK